MRQATGRGIGSFARQAVAVLQRDLSRNVANAYHWYHLLLALRRDGPVTEETECALLACVRVINDGAPIQRRSRKDQRRSRDVQRAWNARMPAMGDLKGAVVFRENVCL